MCLFVKSKTRKYHILDGAIFCAHVLKSKIYSDSGGAFRCYSLWYFGVYPRMNYSSLFYKITATALLIIHLKHEYLEA